MTFSGAENGTRTRDLNLGKVALYQLSYFRKVSLIRMQILFNSKNIFVRHERILSGGRRVSSI